LPSHKFSKAFFPPSLSPATRRSAHPGWLSFVCIPAFCCFPVGEFCLDDYFPSQRVKRAANVLPVIGVGLASKNPA